MDKLEWWKKHEHDLPHWSQAAGMFCLCSHPLLYTAERLFSILSVLLIDKYIGELH